MSENENIYSNSEIVQKLVDVLGKESVEHFAKYLEQHDKIATGNLINGLSYSFKQLLTTLSIEFSTEKYLEYVNRGRPSGYFPNVKAIADWLTAKGLDLSPWAVSVNIYKYGIKPTPVLEDYFKSNLIDNAVEKITEIFSVETEKQIINLINEMNKPK